MFVRVCCWFFNIYIRNNFVDFKECCGVITCVQNNYRHIEVCFQPCDIHLWLTGLKAPTN